MLGCVKQMLPPPSAHWLDMRFMSPMHTRLVEDVVLMDTPHFAWSCENGGFCVPPIMHDTSELEHPRYRTCLTCRPLNPTNCASLVCSHLRIRERMRRPVCIRPRQPVHVDRIVRKRGRAIRSHFGRSAQQQCSVVSQNLTITSRASTSLRQVSQ